MDAERSTAVGPQTANDIDVAPPLRLEHLSLLPVAAAAAAVVSGMDWAWPVAAMLLSVAYLALYLRIRFRDA
jgi:hypothetical protein